jgi:hypothetical protein
MSGETVYARIKQLFEEIRSERTRKASRKSGDLRSRTRKRSMPLYDMPACILAKKGLSAVVEIRKFFLAAGKTAEQGVSKQDYLKQRRKLHPEVFRLLNGGYLKQFYGGLQAKGWRGYLVLAEDGSRRTKVRQKYRTARRTGRPIGGTGTGTGKPLVGQISTFYMM